MFRTLPLALLLLPLLAPTFAKKPNVLFIAVDDLRPELHCYGKTHIHSPNLDRLAASGTLFERAYCMVPTCGASRASLMTGLRPKPDRFTSHKTIAADDAPGIVTLNTHFKRQGYETVSLGKVFHTVSDNVKGWSKPPWKSKASVFKLSASYDLAKQSKHNRGPPTESAEVAEAEYADGDTAAKALLELQAFKQNEAPFFLAVGFVKPHLPFVAPKKYWDLYNPATIDLPDNYHPPENVPPDALHSSGELRKYATVPENGPVSDAMAKDMIHGYYACVSFIDAQIGKLLAELDRLELADNTIVVVWGDHGWNLGEHTLWCKHSCFETSLHAPLIVRAPGVSKAGGRVPALTEFIDIYPTLCALADLPLPKHLQGKSFVAQLEDPDTPGKSVAVSRYKNGDSVRNNHYRFTDYTQKAGAPIPMLYNHRTDADENVNIAGEEKEAARVQRLRERLETVRQSMIE